MRERIEQLKAEISLSEDRYHVFAQIEAEMLQNIPRHGFAVACQKVGLVGQMPKLAEKIRRKKIMLVCIRG